MLQSKKCSRLRSRYFCLSTTISISRFAAYSGAYITGGTTYPPGYTIDADGVVLFEGAIVATAAYAGNAVLATLTGLPFNYPQASHNLVYAPGVAVGIIRYGTNSGTPLTGTKQVNLGFGLAVGNYVILDNFVLVNPASTTTPTILAAGVNGWTTYAASWRFPSFAITPDKQVFLFGLWNGGTPGTVMMAFSSAIKPRWNLVMAVLNNSTAVRLDVRGTDSAVVLTAGSTAWTSLDGTSYALYNSAKYEQGD